MSGTTTGGGPPPDSIIISDPKNGKCAPLARSDIKHLHDSLQDGDPVKDVLKQFVTE
jgi:hypothetical protein